MTHPRCPVQYIVVQDHQAVLQVQRLVLGAEGQAKVELQEEVEDVEAS